MLHRAHISGMTMDPASNNPIVMLKINGGEQIIPIWIGLLEATSIASVLQNVTFERPMTHDLFKNFLTRMSLRILKIEVCDLKKNTFFAKIYFGSGDDEFFLDARPRRS